MMSSPLGPTVFVVDDYAPGRKSIARLLRTAGFAVTAFATAKEFLAQYDPETPGCHSEASRSQQARDRFPTRRIIVHDEDGGAERTTHHQLSVRGLADASLGSEKWNVAPRSGLFVAQSFPRCAVMMVRQTERPRPIP